jgi:hypothetical protein
MCANSECMLGYMGSCRILWDTHVPCLQAKDHFQINLKLIFSFLVQLQHLLLPSLIVTSSQVRVGTPFPLLSCCISGLGPEGLLHNESVDRWNAIVQRINTGIEYKLMSRDNFEEMDGQNGHLKKMLTKAVLNKFWKNGVPNHELTLKTGDICLITRAINSLGLANNSQV